MKKVGLWLLLVSLFFFTNNSFAGDEKKPPKAGEPFPAITLPIPEDSENRSYLGLSAGKGSFEISSIKADVLIIEIFSMYCPYCQREAPEVNKLYEKIDKRPDIKDRIKLIGIGAGNSSFEVDAFRNKYKIPFPLFQDQEFLIYKLLGEVRTPYFFVLGINKGGSNQVLYSELGGLNGAESFLNRVMNLLGPARED